MFYSRLTTEAVNVLANPFQHCHISSTQSTLPKLKVKERIALYDPLYLSQEIIKKI